MLQHLSSGHVVWKVQDGECGSISPSLLNQLKNQSQKYFFSKEAGGLILGFIDNQTKGLLAEELTFPGKGDKRSRTSFYRSDRHQKEAEIWNKNTDGKGTQLGLWHTHPEYNPKPSSVDIEDCFNVLNVGSFDCDGLLYMIVGTNTIGCWYASKPCSMHLLGYIML